MESKKINQLATELAPDLSDLTIIGDPTTGISKKITLSQMASLFTGTVEEYANFAAFPLVGTADTIYVAKDTNILYRWDTTLTSYVELSPNIVTSLVFSDANGFDGTISLVGSTATLTITTALTTGSVPFIGASGALSQDNANLFFDDTNNRLGINTNAPTTALDVFGSGIIGRINGTSTNNAFLGFSSAGTNKWSIGNVQSDHRFRIYNEATTSELVSVLSTGEFGIGIANPLTKFHIDGGATALIANLDADVSVAKSVSFRSDNSARINLEVSGTESGTNAGANFFLRTYTDAGSLIETPLSIVRSTGVTTIKSLTLTNVLSVANGGTGSATQNFVDLTTTQTIAGAKTFSNNIIVAPTTLTGAIQFGTSNPSTIGYDASTGALTLNITAGSAATSAYYRFLADGNSIVTFTKGGNVGIGSILPSGIVNGKGLVIYDTNYPRLILQNSTTGTGTGAYSGLWMDTNDIYVQNSQATGKINFGVNSSSQAMTITNIGYVGIGTASPTHNFEIANASGSTYIKLNADFGIGYIGMETADDSMRFVTASANPMQFYTGNVLRMTIAGSGAVTYTNAINFGSLAYASLSAGAIAYDSLYGISLKGKAGSAYDFVLFNAGGSGILSNNTGTSTLNTGGALAVAGALSKGSGSFKIEHPLESLSETHQLVHSFIEGPRVDLIYRGKITLENGKAQVNIDEISTMTEGTFEVLCREVQCFTTNESGYDLIKGKVIGNIIYIESQNEKSFDEISWMVIGERKDKHIMETEWTDDNGKVIVEPLKPNTPPMPNMQ